MVLLPLIFFGIQIFYGVRVDQIWFVKFYIGVWLKNSAVIKERFLYDCKSEILDIYLSMENKDSGILMNITADVKQKLNTTMAIIIFYINFVLQIDTNFLVIVHAFCIKWKKLLEYFWTKSKFMSFVWSSWKDWALERLFEKFWEKTQMSFRKGDIEILID